jgi:hypothetical protein
MTYPDYITQTPAISYQWACVLLYYDVTQAPPEINVYRRDKPGYYLCARTEK